MTSCETCGCSVPDLFWHWRSCPACIPDLHWSWEPAPEPAPPVSPTSEAARNEEEEAARLRCHLTKHLGILHLKDKVTMPMLNTFHDLIEGKSDFASALYVFLRPGRRRNMATGSRREMSRPSDAGAQGPSLARVPFPIAFARRSHIPLSCADRTVGTRCAAASAPSTAVSKQWSRIAVTSHMKTVIPDCLATAISIALPYGVRSKRNAITWRQWPWPMLGTTLSQW